MQDAHGTRYFGVCPHTPARAQVDGVPKWPYPCADFGIKPSETVGRLLAAQGATVYG
jgi:hypothetical protein